MTEAAGNDAARKWRRRRRRFRRRLRRAAEIGGLLLFAAIVVWSLSRHSASKRSAPTTVPTTVPVLPPSADVKVTSCNFKRELEGYADLAGLTITNHTQQKLNYTIHVYFGDRAVKHLGPLAIVTINELGPKQRVKRVAIAPILQPPKKLVCVLTEVQRFAQ